MPKSASNAETRSPSASPAVMAAINLAIVFHLLALAIMAIIQLAPDASMSQRLRNAWFFTAGLRQLDMDRPYDMTWTRGLAVDVDHRLAVEIPNESAATATGLAPDATESTRKTIVVVFPEPNLGGWRAKRFRNLANTVAALSQNEDAAGILPQGVARSVLVEHGATRGRIRCIGHLLPDMADSRDGVDTSVEGYYSDAFVADIKLIEGELWLNRLIEPLELAPPPKSPTQAPAAQDAAPRSNPKERGDA